MVAKLTFDLFPGLDLSLYNMQGLLFCSIKDADRQTDRTKQ